MTDDRRYTESLAQSNVSSLVVEISNEECTCMKHELMFQHVIGPHANGYQFDTVKPVRNDPTSRDQPAQERPLIQNRFSFVV